MNNSKQEENVNKNTTEETPMLSSKNACKDITTHYERYGKKAYLNHREKNIERSKDWGRKNPEKVKARRAKYRKVRALRCLAKRANFLARKIDPQHYNKITPFDLWKIAKKQKLLCSLTGDKLTSLNASVDHIIPSSKGGKNIVTNIRLVTKDANFMKNSHSDEEFLELCKKVVNYFI